MAYLIRIRKLSIIRRKIKMFKSVDFSKLYSLLALLLFVAAVFTITDGKFWLGVVLIVAGACFSSGAAIQKKKRKDDTC